MKIKIVYIGTVKFSEILLKEIIKYKNYIDIYIISSKKRINSDHEDLNRIAKREKLPIHLTSNINSNQTFKKIKNFKPDYIFCLGWSRLLKKIIKCANTVWVISAELLKIVVDINYLGNLSWS